MIRLAALGAKIFPFWPLALALAVAGLYLWVDHRGYKRAEERARIERIEAQESARQMVERINQNIRASMVEIERRAATRINQIDVTERTIVQPTIEREIASDPRRYSSPDCTLTPGMLDALNRAAAASADPAAPGANP